MSLYKPKNFERLLGTPGFSDDLLKTHFTLYGGYVKGASDLHERLQDCLKAGDTATPEFAEQKRRFAWEFNGMRLHELYFENMTKEKSDQKAASGLRRQLTKDFGSADAWSKEFKATGSLRGIGWAALFWDPVGQRLFDAWINEHDGGYLADCSVVLLMDVFEHAFMRDYGTKRADYIEAFFTAIDWEIVESRFDTAVSRVTREAVTSSRA